MISRLLTATQFLTLFPVKLPAPGSLSESALFFPAVGAILGSFAGLTFFLSRPNLGPSIASGLALVMLLFMTGCLHEDGLADVADALRAGRSRATMLGILKDSRIGAYGAIALIASLLLRWQALSQCRINPVLGLAAALTLSRSSMVALAGFSPPAGGGLGASFVRDLSSRTAFTAVLSGVLLACLAARFTGLVMAASTGLLVVLARFYFVRRLGGVSGDCLGATCQIVETVNLLVLAWQPST